MLKKTIKGILYVALHYPLLDILIFYSFYFRATLTLGYFPTYNNPDPKVLGFVEHLNIAWVSSEPIPYIFGILIVYGFICLLKNKNVLGIKSIHFRLFFIYICIMIATLFSPVFEWFVD